MDSNIQEILDYYKNDRTLSQSEAVIAMLTEIQEKTGYISEDIKEKVAETAGVNAGFVTVLIKRLPHLHTQPFRYEIQVCVSEQCKENGSSKILDALKKRLKIKPGQATKDGRFLLTTRPCMHSCKTGPNLTVQGKLYTKVTPEDIIGILSEYKVDKSEPSA